jgi:ATP-dependent RNA helicase DDX54/DBP10
MIVLQAVFGAPRKRAKTAGKAGLYQDPQFYLNYEQEGADTERG